MRERDLFLRALDIDDAAARSRFLDRACRGNAALREGIDRLLAWHGRGPGWLEEPLPERLAGEEHVFPDGPAPPDEAADHGDGPERPLRSADPETLGAVRILPRPSDTPFGRAFAGRDERRSEDVVVKTLGAAWARDPQARGRFLAMAWRLAAVRHEVLPAVTGVGEDPFPWIAFERLDAEPLALRAKRGPLATWDDARRVGIGVAGGLARIHDAGLVHRALSPDVVLLGPGASGTRPWLADVGLAHAVGGPDRGIPPGSDPGFLAPEQVIGERLDPLDHRPDLFALGCLLVFLVAGRSPFDAGSREGPLRRVADVSPHPGIMAALPPGLSAAVGELLRADPDARPASASVVAERLAGSGIAGR